MNLPSFENLNSHMTLFGTHLRILHLSFDKINIGESHTNTLINRLVRSFIPSLCLPHVFY
jgi:hypothetical protein